MVLNVTITWPFIAVNYLIFFFFFCNEKAAAALKLSLLLYLKLTFTPLFFSVWCISSLVNSNQSAVLSSGQAAVCLQEGICIQ